MTYEARSRALRERAANTSGLSSAADLVDFLVNNAEKVEAVIEAARSLAESALRVLPTHANYCPGAAPGGKCGCLSPRAWAEHAVFMGCLRALDEPELLTGTMPRANPSDGTRALDEPEEHTHD